MAILTPALPSLSKNSEKRIRQQLERILNSRTFREAGRLKRFIGFIVNETLEGRIEELKEYVVGVQVFEKKESFDPRTDPIVRVQARRLRVMLDRYYRDEGYDDEIVIELPKGGYGPEFRNRNSTAAKSTLTATLVSRNTVAVLAFSDDSPLADLGYFCEAVRQEIICGITKLPSIRILACHPALLREDAGRAIGRNAATVVSGSIRRCGDDIRITAHLIDGASGCYLWSETVDGRLPDAFSIQKDVAHLVVEKLRTELAGFSNFHSARHQAVSAAARNLYLQARYHLNQRTEEGLKKAAEFFEKAIAEDAQYALAHSGLADAYGLLAHYGVVAPADVWTKAASSAAAAVMLDESSAESHTSQAHVKATQDWDWAGAEIQFRHAISLDPSYPTAHHWYAMSCLVPLGRLDEALDQVLTAQSLDPVSSIIARDVAVVYYYRREFDAALEQCDHTIELNPHFAPAFWTLGLIQEQRQDFEEAAAGFQRAIYLSPETPRGHAALGHLYAVSGKRKAGLEGLHKLQTIAASRYVSPFEFASLHFALDQPDLAFDWLAKASHYRCFELLSINVNPGLDSMRADRRFQLAARQFACSSLGKQALAG